MPVLPAEIPTRLVTGQFYFVSADMADANTDPELERVTGFVRFTSTARVLRMPTKKSLLIPLEFDCKFNGQGQLVTLEDTTVGLKLPRTDSDLINPVDYTWRADFYLNRASNNRPIPIDSFEFKVPAPPAGKPNEPLDLSEVMPVQSSPGVQIIQGPAGKDGSNVVPAQQAVAGYITTEGNPVREAIAATVASETGSQVPPLVAKAIAADGTITAAAGAAVEADIAGRDLVEGLDQRMQRVFNNPTYAWAVTDQRRRASILVRHDGVVEIPGLPFAETYLSGSAFQPFIDGAYVGGFTDGRQYSELVIQKDGTVPKWAAKRIVERGLEGITLPGAGGGPSAVALPSIAAWGDSITQMGLNADSWITLLAADLGVDYYNGGWTSQQPHSIAARQGGQQSLVTFANNAIPASGPASVTLTNNPVDMPSATHYERRGEIAGIPGVLKADTWQGPWWFTRDTAGAAVTLPSAAKFTPTDGATRRNWTQIYWSGRNGGSDVTKSMNAMRGMVGYQTAGVKRFLVLEVLPWKNDATDVGPLNWAYSQEWPENYVRIAQWLRTDAAAAAVGISFTAADREDIAAGWTPGSFRADDVHLNTVGRRAVKERLKQEFISRGWK